MTYSQLHDEDRFVIEKLLKSRKKQIEIAEIIGCHPSTISRELTRNKSGGYFARSAIQISRKRRKKSKYKKLYDERLRSYVVSKLSIGWSPEEISNRLHLEYPDDLKMRISYESIYKWIYEKKTEGNLLLYKYLEQSHKKRQKRGSSKEKRSIIKDRKSIHSRPDVADTREEIGHWEGDTIVGKGRDGLIATFVDRKSRFLVAHKMVNKRADTLCRAAFEGFGDIPNDHIETMTFDNGVEFTKFKTLEEVFECSIYFADPYSSWQRGTNEYTNRLLRRFFHKKMSFKNLEQNCIDYVVSLLNNKPRKCLKYLTPYEVYFGKKIALQG